MILDPTCACGLDRQECRRPDCPQGEDEPELPKYSDPGRVLFRWYRDPEFAHQADGFCCEVYDYDADSCLFWMYEGVGVNYILENCLDLEQEGWYVAEGITGALIRYTSDLDDVDEEWYFDGCIRYATDEEIDAKCLS